MKIGGQRVMLILVVVIVDGHSVMHFVIRRFAGRESIFFCMSRVASVCVVRQSKLKTLVAKKRHHHQPRHVHGGQNRGEKTDNPQNRTGMNSRDRGFTDSTTSRKRTIKNFVL